MGIASELEIAGLNSRCSAVDSSIYFTIKNVGANMSAASEYRLYGSTGFIFADTFHLNMGDSLIISLNNANGYSWIEVDNTPNHPFQPLPQTAPLFQL